MQTFKKKRIICDLSSILWSGLLAGKDDEFGRDVEFNGRKVYVNSAVYGFENCINHFVAVLEATGLTPMHMILVVEGMNSKSLRQSVLPTYKGGTEPSRPPEAYEEFNKLKAKLLDTFLSLGANAVTQDGIEGDDVIAYLATHLDGEKIIDSGDGDLSVLISDGSTGTTGVSLYRQGGFVTENPLGPFPCKYVTVYKALVGDTSDKIPGAKGFGKAAWLDMLCTFGYDGLEMMHDLFITKQLHRLAEDVAEFKPLQKIIDDAKGAYNSFTVARLYPEKVNTVRRPLEWSAGMVKPRTADTDPRVKQWAGAVRLVTAENYDEALKFFRSKIAESPFISFDIETSSCDEGDEWLREVAGKSDDEDVTGVDVFGATLTGFGITFGCNMQYTFYWSVDHLPQPGQTNITKAQAKAVLESVPASKRTVIQNAQFELPIIYEELGPLEVAA